MASGDKERQQAYEERDGVEKNREELEGLHHGCGAAV